MNIAHRFLLGRYTGRESVISKIDPRLKILFLIMISVTLLKIKSPAEFIVPFSLLLVVTLAGRVKFNVLIKGMVPIVWLTVFTFFLHSVLPPHDINTAVVVALRLVMLFGWASVITATTKVIYLGRAVAWYLTPLKIFGLNPGDVALTFTLAIRFFPLILEEAESVIKAQKLKASKLKIKDRLEAFVTVFFIRVFKRAEKVEDTMKNREINSTSIMEFQTVIKSSMAANLLTVVMGAGYIYIMTAFNL
ncbi:MAG: energy-coupling factor transporter transmembrane component T [Elusimicrobia bacterium]|jgi:energy-coupling factor transport system permease protein|nr:energy-coupling factor transporter transmembrane component T [Elusimicrobiota bacterium]